MIGNTEEAEKSELAPTEFLISLAPLSLCCLKQLGTIMDQDVDFRQSREVESASIST